MEPFIQKLKDLIARHFPDSELEVELTGSDRIAAYLVWAGFADYEQIQRQRQVWSVLRQALSREEQLMISVILTLTPEEMTFARQD